MPTFTPVDFDPFGSQNAAPRLVPVDHDPFAAPRRQIEMPAYDAGGNATGTTQMVDAQEALPSKTRPVGQGEDIVRSLGIGLVKGAIGTATAGGDIRNVLSQGVDYAAKQFGVPQDKVGQFKNSVYESARFVPLASVVANSPTSGEVQKSIEGVTGDFYKPKTTLGEGAQTIGEFAPAAFGGEASLIGRGARVLFPAITSETAGQATKDTAAEPVARFLGALAGGGVTALASRPGTTARSISQQLPQGVTEQMVNRADGLIQEAASRGVSLAWPEALSQVAGRPVLTNMMRHLEASPQTEGQMASFFGNRAPQVENAVRSELDNIAPINQAPSTIGPAVGRASEDTLEDVRKAINKTAEPFYDSASTVLLSPSDMARVRALPGYEDARAAVRGDPQLNRYVENLPDHSVGFLNEVKKQLDNSSQHATQPLGTQGRNMQRSAGFSQDAEAVKNIASNVPTSTAYPTALAIESVGREKYLQPLLDGPLGKLAGRDTATKSAIETLFPKNPLPNSEGEISTAVSAVAKRSPKAASDLVRAHAESTFNEAARDLQTGPNQANGAKFRAAIVGNPQQEANLKAAVEALPNGKDRWEGFGKLLDVLEATGTRQGIGSRTAYNAEINKMQSAGSVGRDAVKIGANPLKVVQPLIDRYEQYKLGQNLGQLANVLTDPGSVNLLRAIARAPRNSNALPVLASRLAIYSEASRPNASN